MGCSFYGNGYAQDTLRLEGDVPRWSQPVVWVEVNELPVAFHTLNAIGLGMAQHEDSGIPALYYALDSATMVYFQDLTAGPDVDVWFNRAKAYWPPTMRGDTLMFWSEMPYRATQLHYRFIWKEGQFRYVDGWYEDPSEDAVREAESRLAQGDVMGAMHAYFEVMYPHAYLNEDRVCKALLDEAYQQGWQHYKEGRLQMAPALLDSVLQEYFCPAWLHMATRYDFEESIEQAYGQFHSDTIYTILTDYAMFQEHAGNWKKANNVRQKLNVFFPDRLETYLYLADNLFALEEKIPAAALYMEYVQLMRESDRKKEIEKRARQRAK